MTLHPEARALLREIEQFMRRKGMEQTVFGIKAMNDGNFIPRLRRGRTPKLETFDRVRRFIKENSNGKPQR